MFAFSDQDWPGLAKLVEECGECNEVLIPTILATAMSRIIRTSGKLMMTHGDSDHWSGNLRKQLMEEIADVDAASIFFKEHCFSKREQSAMAKRTRAKVKKFEKWDREHEVRQRKTKKRSQVSNAIRSTHRDTQSTKKRA